MHCDLYLLRRLLVSLEDVMAQVLDLPEVAAWPEMANLFERTVPRYNVKWELPLMACHAVDGEESIAVVGAAAVACMQLSLVLVDDMLDNDPRGAYNRLGSAVASNLAFAFQAAAFRLIEQAPVEAERHAAVYASLAQMALACSFGQDLDARNLGGEESYWRVVKTKSSPFFGTSLYIGALLGRASFEVAERLRKVGLLIGEIIQVYDDLMDALQSPASPDWTQRRNNLAILYALTIDHPERTRFEALRDQVDDSQALEAAQQILIRCGAVSYCVYHIIKRHQAARRLLDGPSLADTGPLRNLIHGQTKPLVNLLQSAGASIPPELGDF
jgi:geranylgeranyl pyrophosphate synthase